MKIKMTPTIRAFLQDLEDQAEQQGKQVDFETLTLVPISGYPREWPMGDNDPKDPEQAGWDEL